MRKFISFLVFFALVFTGFSFNAVALPTPENAKYDCKSAILIEASTGKVLYEQNADEDPCHLGYSDHCRVGSGLCRSDVLHKDDRRQPLR